MTQALPEPALSERERYRLQVLRSLLAGRLDTAEAARLLRLSSRQVRRLLRALALEGSSGLAHAARGRRSPRRLSDVVRQRVCELVATTYRGLSQQRICERLAREEQIRISRTTLHRLLRESELRPPRARRPRRLPATLLPVGFDFAARRVELLDLRGALFREPSYDQSVGRWRRERPGALALQLDFETFVGVARADAGTHPAGLIFDAGRGGATWLADLLSQADELRVIKDASAVNTLVAMLLTAPSEELRAEREELLGATLPYLGRQGGAPPRYLIYKLSSWNAAAAAQLLRLLPETRAVFLHRPAAETVAALLADPPGWRTLMQRPRAVQARFFPSLAEAPLGERLSGAAFYAHAWRSSAEAALVLPPERLLVLSEQHLQQPEEVIARVLEHLAIELPPAGQSALHLATRMLADDRNQAGARPVGLDLEQRAVVLAIVGDLDQRLAALNSGCAN